MNMKAHFLRWNPRPKFPLWSSYFTHIPDYLAESFFTETSDVENTSINGYFHCRAGLESAVYIHGIVTGAERV